MNERILSIDNLNVTIKKVYQVVFKPKNRFPRILQKQKMYTNNPLPFRQTSFIQKLNYLTLDTSCMTKSDSPIHSNTSLSK